MAYDDTPYWQRNKEPSEEIKPSIKPEAPNSPKVKRSIPWANEVTDQMERRKRGEKPSPLLEAYMKEHGLPVV